MALLIEIFRCCKIGLLCAFTVLKMKINIIHCGLQLNLKIISNSHGNRVFYSNM